MSFNKQRVLIEKRLYPLEHDFLTKKQKDFLKMARSYLSDSIIFEGNSDFINCQRSLDSCIGWIECIEKSNTITQSL